MLNLSPPPNGRLNFEHGPIVENLLTELKRYVDFEAGDTTALRAFGQHAEPYIPAITETFYAKVDANPETRSAIQGPGQRAHLKTALCAWLQQLLLGPWDQAYYEQRAELGRAHVAVHIPARYMLGAMSVIRSQLLVLADAYAGDGSERTRLSLALHRLLDLELAIMLDGYTAKQVPWDDSPAERGALREANYREIFEQAEALITTTDQHARIGLGNAKCEALTGIPRANMHGASWLELFASEAERPALAALLQDVFVHRRSHVRETTARGAHRIRWHFAPLPESTALCAIGIDVTQEHELALRARRAERLAALGTMAAGLAHELRNPLNAANLQLSVAQRRLARGTPSDLKPAERAIELADTELKRLAALVEDFLAFAQPQPLQITRTELGSIARRVVDSMKAEAKAAGVELSYAEAAPLAIEVDIGRIRQVLVNLVRNAIEATPRQGHVSVACERVDAGAKISVQDDGCGFPAEAAIFQPFFTTKHQGTGLGLAIVHRIVMDHGGSVDARSEPGRTVFAITLPVTSATRHS